MSFNKNCLVCGDSTEVIVTINLNSKNVCQVCCDCITLQNIHNLIELHGTKGAN